MAFKDLRRRVFGNMTGGADNEEDSLESDSDLVLGGVGVDQGGNLDTDDDEDDDGEELEVNEMAAETLKNRKSALQRAQANVSAIAPGASIGSDDDF